MRKNISIRKSYIGKKIFRKGNKGWKSTIIYIWIIFGFIFGFIFGMILDKTTKSLLQHSLFRSRNVFFGGTRDIFIILIGISQKLLWQCVANIKKQLFDCSRFGLSASLSYLSIDKRQVNERHPTVLWRKFLHIG